MMSDERIGAVPIPVLAYPEPGLGDGRVRLRPWSEDDLDCVREASTDRDITGGTSVPDHFTEASGLAFIHRQWARLADGVGVSQAIVDARTGKAAGLVIVSLRPQPDVAGLGYWVAPSARRTGLATAAVRLLAPWALRSLQLCRLEAWVAPDNVASQRVLRGAEFQLEGRLRNFLSTPDGVTDALVYSQIPT
jgi:RimJ/RimL family protein N-acetyltransferase